MEGIKASEIFPPSVLYSVPTWCGREFSVGFNKIMATSCVVFACVGNQFQKEIATYRILIAVFNVPDKLAPRVMI